MEFFIKKNATLPLLKLSVVKDGRSDYNKMMDLIEESAIFFSMTDVETGIPKIISRPAGFVNKKFVDPDMSPEYYVYYQFTNIDTKKVGRYEGQFLFRNNDGVLILPIREKLYINVQESFIADDLPYENCYVSEFPCCDTSPIITTTTTRICYVEPVVNEFEVLIETFISPGSIVFDFVVTLPRALNIDYTVVLTKTFNVSYGEPIVLTAEVTVLSGKLKQTKQVIIDDNINRILYNSEITNVNHITKIDGLIVKERVGDVVYMVTPTPTPTSSVTITPTPTSSVTITPTPTPTSTPSVTIGLTPTPTSTNTPTPTPTLTNTPTPTNTPTLTPTQNIVLSNNIMYGKSPKQSLIDSDMLTFDNLILDLIYNTHLTFDSVPGYCYIMVPEYMDQPRVFRNSNDGCDGFLVPFVRIEDKSITDKFGNIIIYYVYRSFVLTYASVDIWICE